MNGVNAHTGETVSGLGGPHISLRWVVYTSRQDADSDHAYEVWVRLEERGYKSPVWPVLACSSLKSVEKWRPRFIALIRSFPLTTYDDRLYYSEEENGDIRIADWLRAHRWRKYNHIWWNEPDPLVILSQAPLEGL